MGRGRSWRARLLILIIRSRGEPDKIAKQHGDDLAFLALDRTGPRATQQNPQKANPSGLCLPREGQVITNASVGGLRWGAPETRFSGTRLGARRRLREGDPDCPAAFDLRGPCAWELTRGSKGKSRPEAAPLIGAASAAQRSTSEPSHRRPSPTSSPAASTSRAWRRAAILVQGMKSTAP